VGEPPYYFGGPDTLAEKRMPDRHELAGELKVNATCPNGTAGAVTRRWCRPRW